MKLTIEFDGEWWRVRYWWRATLCKWFGHPEFTERTPRAGLTGMYFNALFGIDNRDRCVRCGAPDPTEVDPGPYTHGFEHLGDM